jgi:RNA polymerase sigma-70 factor (TIGR02957 family)
MTDAAFVRHRSLLFTVAYEMLGSAADAEDVVQETWLRWAEVDQAQVADPRSYLVKIVTRLALNRLRTLARQREDYVGPWLPEPLLIGPDPAHDAEFAENVSIAMLTVLETLGPAERAVFVLREVFQTPHEEIADAVGKTPAAVRQIARRAREHVAARRPRMQVSQAEQQAAVQRFLGAVATGELQALMEVLAPDVVMIADGGGLQPTARKPVAGAKRVAVYLSHAAKIPDFTAAPAWINAMAGIRIDVAGSPTAVSLVCEDGLITRIYAIRNPDKLRWLERTAELVRGPSPPGR